MSISVPMSHSGPLSYSYTSGNSYSYSYTGGNSYSYSQPMEAYGFDGMPGNSMLAAGLQAARGAIRRELFAPNSLGGASDVGGNRKFRGADFNALPPLDSLDDLGRCGVQVRQSMAMLELMSSVSFVGDVNSGWCELSGRSGNGWAMLLKMKRPARSYFEAQLALTDSWAASRDSRAAEVLTQVAPPLAYFASLMNLQAARHRKTLEFITLSLQFAYAVCMRFKQALNCPRPSEYSAAIMPMLELPPHRSLPAGHASEAHLTAAILATLAGINAPASLPQQALRRLAHRIAENREVAGLHFPIDNVAGRLMGDALASFVLSAGSGAAEPWMGGVFDGPAAGAPASGSIEADSAQVQIAFAGPGCSPAHQDMQPAAPLMPVVRQMWQDAVKEWDR